MLYERNVHRTRSLYSIWSRMTKFDRVFEMCTTKIVFFACHMKCNDECVAIVSLAIRVVLLRRYRMTFLRNVSSMYNHCNIGAISRAHDVRNCRSVAPNTVVC